MLLRMVIIITAVNPKCLQLTSRKDGKEEAVEEEEVIPIE